MTEPGFDLATYYPIFAYLVVLIGFVITVMILTHTIGPWKRTPTKQMPYESGMDPIGDARQRFDVKFYLVAIMFLVGGIELMAVGASKHDIARFGAEVMRFSPRQCDLMIVAGRVVMKMLPVLQRIWLQMPEPKWCISMGACASSGGVFDTYAVVQGVD